MYVVNGNLTINVDAANDVAFVVGGEADEPLFTFRGVHDAIVTTNDTLTSHDTLLAQHTQELASQDSSLMSHDASLQSLTSIINGMSGFGAAITANAQTNANQDGVIAALTNTVSSNKAAADSTFATQSTQTNAALHTLVDPLSTVVTQHTSTLTQHSTIIAQNAASATSSLSTLTAQTSTADAANAAQASSALASANAIITCTKAGNIYDSSTSTCIKPNFAFASVRRTVIWQT
jgi:hypothetical protein